MSKSNTNRPGELWAEVRAHDQVMRYRRSGAGRAVLLLRPADRPDALWPEVEEMLEAQFRLIVPDVPPGEPDASSWLAGFIEGIGMPSMGIVAVEELCHPALELAQRDPEQVSRLVLVTVGEQTVPYSATVPSIVVRRDRPAAEVLPAVTRLLAGE